jgi:ankyrin repeat protein
MHACAAGNHEVVELLLRRGADMEVKDTVSTTVAA